MSFLGAEPSFPQWAQGGAPSHAHSQRTDARDLSGVLIWRRGLEIGGKNPSPPSGELCREAGSLCESQASLGGDLPAKLVLGKPFASLLLGRLPTSSENLFIYLIYFLKNKLSSS